MHSSSMNASFMGNICAREIECPKDDSGSKSSPIHAILVEVEAFEIFFQKINGQRANVFICLSSINRPIYFFI